jgi:hypothetical protein
LAMRLLVVPGTNWNLVRTRIRFVHITNSKRAKYAHIARSGFGEHVGAPGFSKINFSTVFKFSKKNVIIYICTYGYTYLCKISRQNTIVCCLSQKIENSNLYLFEQ